jgi:hypothetical protein
VQGEAMVAGVNGNTVVSHWITTYHDREAHRRSRTLRCVPGSKNAAIRELLWLPRDVCGGHHAARLVLSGQPIRAVRAASAFSLHCGESPTPRSSLSHRRSSHERPSDSPPSTFGRFSPTT